VSRERPAILTLIHGALTMSVGLTEAILNTYDGKKMSEICIYHYHDKDFNHCAHFVSHVLGLGNRTLGETCANLTVSDKGLLTKEGITGAFIRVHELFAMCSMCAVFDLTAVPAIAPLTATTAGGAASTMPAATATTSGAAAMTSSFPVATATTSGGMGPAAGAAAGTSSAPPNECLVYVTFESAVNLKTQTMTNTPYKHVGIYFNGKIWQHGKSAGKVVVMTPADFAAIYAATRKEKTIMVYTDFPSGASAVSLATAKAVKAIPATTKDGKRDKPTEIWYDGKKPAKKAATAPAIAPLTTTTAGAAATTSPFPAATTSTAGTPVFRRP
jgi:hypothetical protein